LPAVPGQESWTERAASASPAQTGHPKAWVQKAWVQKALVQKALAPGLLAPGLLAPGLA
jgi:hypothetical protein